MSKLHPQLVPAKVAFASDREQANDQNPQDPDHHSHEDRNDLEQGLAGDHRIPQSLVVYDGDRNAPPGQKCVHGGSDQPSGKQIPAFGLFPDFAFRGE